MVSRATCTAVRASLVQTPKTVALRLFNFWSTCPEFLGLVGQDWDKIPKPSQSIDGLSDTRQGNELAAFALDAKRNPSAYWVNFQFDLTPPYPHPPDLQNGSPCRYALGCARGGASSAVPAALLAGHTGHGWRHHPDLAG
jgi:hypothetical protein